MKNALIIILLMPILSFGQNFKCQSDKYELTISKNKKSISVNLVDLGVLNTLKETLKDSPELLEVLVKEYKPENSISPLCAEMDRCELKEVDNLQSLNCVKNENSKNITSNVALKTNSEGNLFLSCSVVIKTGNSETHAYSAYPLGSPSEVVCQEI